MLIDCISDLHGYFPILEGGDLLIVAGDHTASDKIVQWANFFRWLKRQNYNKKIVIAGNHDNIMMRGWPKNKKEAEDLKEIQEFLDDDESKGITDFDYLCDSETEFQGLKIWGSPWTSQFPGINPKCCAFTRPYQVPLQDKWNMIPNDVDILITHSPPYRILDTVATQYGANVGDVDLLLALNERIKPKLHVFGHIHENGGKQLVFKRPGIGTENNTICVNASYVDERYRPVNNPIRIVL